MPCAVSVIIPVYNAQAHLGSCLDSLLSQHLRHMEILVVDDASTDDSPAIAHCYATEYPDRIRLLSLPRNMGPGAARNAGLDFAQGDYVGFTDADDTVEAGMFACLHNAAVKARAQVAICGMSLVFEKYCQQNKVVLPENICNAKDLLNNSAMISPPWNKICLRTFIMDKNIRFPETRMSEDMVFAFKIMAYRPDIAVCAKALYNYRRHGECASLDMARRHDAIASMEHLGIWLRQNRFSASCRKEYLKMLFLHLFYYPACHVLIDALLKGQNRSATLRESPHYLYELGKFLLTVRT